MNAFSAFLVASLGLIVGAPAMAHTKLVASSPAANATVGKTNKIVLSFNEKVMAPFTGAELIMTGMPGMANHGPMKMTGVAAKVSPDGKSMTLTTQRPLPAGTYQVKWHAAGSDTHRMEGSFSFAVK